MAIQKQTDQTEAKESALENTAIDQTDVIKFALENMTHVSEKEHFEHIGKDPADFQRLNLTASGIPGPENDVYSHAIQTLATKAIREGCYSVAEMDFGSVNLQGVDFPTIVATGYRPLPADLAYG